MSWRLSTGCALLLVLPVAAGADDGGVYETLDSIRIGRVFLGPAERRWLDSQRGRQPVTRAARPRSIPSQPVASAPEKATPAAGYIIGSSGQARVWQDGDFVVAQESAPQGISFPGEVRVKRHGETPGGLSQAQDAAAITPTAEDREERAVGDGAAADAD